jgi:hypothetical protein
MEVVEDLRSKIHSLRKYLNEVEVLNEESYGAKFLDVMRVETASTRPRV